MAAKLTDRESDDASDFSLVRNDLLFRLQRQLGLAPAEGLGTGRRALFWALLAWLPIAVWAMATGHLLARGGGESLLQHFGVNVRCLVAIPLFIAAEGVSHRLTVSLMPYFVTSGLVSAADVPRFRTILRDLARLRDTVYPWVVILALVVAVESVAMSVADTHELIWAGPPGDTAALGFGGWWYLYVARSIFLVLLLAWVWRVILLLILFLRISRLDLKIVPTHPDGAGGLRFIERFPRAFSPVLLGISSVMAAKWAHDVVYHGTDVQSLRVNMISLAVVLLVIFSAPYLMWIGRLLSAKKQALLDYGALVGDHGRLVRRRWIEKGAVDDEAILAAPELGPVADTVALYETVQKMSIVPLGKAAFLALAVPIAIPMLAVIAIQIPLKDILLTLLKTLA
ncbi:MAG: hypothetical protein MUF20_12885 [Methylotetracoccus sp.]|nr:hypothetical protein [Methylotetracoccus sp.]